MKPRSSTTLWPVRILANALILGVILYAAQVESSDPERYYQLVQEDETLEWATFWAFMLAAALFGKRALEQRRRDRLPWFFLGVALFCVVVGMEEISWGQRLLGFRPPTYFLANNFQQELNLHNVVSKDLRKLALKAIILGYGVVLAIFGQIPVVRAWLRRVGIHAPPIFLLPSFLAIYWLYDDYPWRHTGEWVEYILGLGFLFAALLAVRDPEPREETTAPLWRRLAPTALLWVVVLGLGASSAAWSRQASAAHPEFLEMARLELEALQQDLRNGRVTTRRKVHKRVYTFVEKYDQDGLRSGAFSKLTEQGLPEERARYFLDPWNSPYWIRTTRSGDRSGYKAFVYSFGPNRRRESSRVEILGDDVGTVTLELGR